MKAIMVVKDQTDKTRTAEEYIADYNRVTGHIIETLDPETIQGESFARAYDITLYPTLLVLTDEGVVQAMWRGVEEFPLFDELEGYLTA